MTSKMSKGEDLTQALRVTSLAEDYRKRICEALELDKDDLGKQREVDLDGFGERIVAAAMALGHVAGLLRTYNEDEGVVLGPFREGFDTIVALADDLNTKLH